MKIQRIVDDLSCTLGRSVVITDLDLRPLAASDQEDEIDEVRAHLLLKRRAPEPVRRYVDSLRMTSPTTVPLADYGGRERLAVPLRADGALLATLWLITEGHPPLRPEDYAAIDAAATLLPTLIAPERSSAHDLLSDDDLRSRNAYADAISKRALDRGEDTVVMAVLLPPTADALRVQQVAQRLAGHASPRIVVAGVRGGALIVAARAAHRERVVESVHLELASHGIHPEATGSAAVSSTEVRLGPAADRAILAAQISARVLDAGTPGDIADLGFWALLDGVSAELDDLALFSPAAAILHTGDPATRATVEAYLDSACNVRVACEKLHVHRTTLYYRLDNLHPVVRTALDDGASRSALHLCLKLIRYRTVGAQHELKHPVHAKGVASDQ